MQFFQRFPTLPYQSIERGANTTHQLTRTVPNMTVSLNLTIGDEEGTAFSFYRVTDRDRPDTVSANFYGSTEYAWVILLANGMRDWYDWPLTDREFAEYMARKYETLTDARDGREVAHQTTYQYLWLRPDGQRLVLDREGYLAQIAAGASIIPGIDAYDVTLGRDAVCAVSIYAKEYMDNDARRLIRVPTLASLSNITRQLDTVLKES